MYTSQQTLINDPEHLANGTPAARASRSRPARSPAPIARRSRHVRHMVFLLPLVVIILVMVFRLQALPADILRQELEGFGVALGAAAYGGVLLWRVTRAMEIEQKLQSQQPIISSPSSISPSGLNPAKPQKNPSPIPPVAATPAAPVASLPVEMRT